MSHLSPAIWCLIVWAALVLFSLGWLAWACRRAPLDTDLWPGGDPNTLRLTSEERPYGAQDRRPS